MIRELEMKEAEMAELMQVQYPMKLTDPNFRYILHHGVEIVRDAEGHGPVKMKNTSRPWAVVVNGRYMRGPEGRIRTFKRAYNAYEAYKNLARKHGPEFVVRVLETGGPR